MWQWLMETLVFKETQAQVKRICRKGSGTYRLKSAVLSTWKSLYLQGSKCRWEIASHSVIHTCSPCRFSMLSIVPFRKGRVNSLSYGTLTVSTSGVSAESLINLQPYLLHNKFPREIKSQVQWSIEAKKKLEASGLTNILQLIAHKPWKNTILNSETA